MTYGKSTTETYLILCTKACILILPTVYYVYIKSSVILCHTLDIAILAIFDILGVTLFVVMKTKGHEWCCLAAFVQ